MQKLRNAHLLASWLLVWFALFIGSAVASPWFGNGKLELVCSSAGGAKLAVDGELVGDSVNSGLDCPLCVPSAPPLPGHAFEAAPPSDLAHALRPIRVALLKWLTGSPLPARGPPFSV